MGPDLDLILVTRLLLASVLGGIIGLEREVHGRPAGFRTHLLVSLGSCLFVIVSIQFYYSYGSIAGRPMSADPGRIAAQVVTGIGFLGAGAIIREKASIRGLTTAACLWVAAALGVACGSGLFYLAMSATAVALASLLLLKQVEKRLHRDSYLCVKIWGEDGVDFLSHVQQSMASCGVSILDPRYDRSVEQRRVYIEFQMKRTRSCGPSEIVTRLSALEHVKRVRVE